MLESKMIQICLNLVINNQYISVSFIFVFLTLTNISRKIVFEVDTGGNICQQLKIGCAGFFEAEVEDAVVEYLLVVACSLVIQYLKLIK